MLMRQVGGRHIDPAKVEAVLASAKHSLGVPQLDEERELVMYVAEVRKPATGAL